MEASSFFRCYVGDFWEKYIEPNGYRRISSEDVAAIVQRLKKDGHLMPRAGRWKAFAERNAQASEFEKYELRRAQIASIVEGVITAAVETLRERFGEKDRRCLFECRGSEEELSEIQSANYHVDAINYRAASSCVKDSKRGCAHYTVVPSTKDKRDIDTADITASWQIALKAGPAGNTHGNLKERSVETARHYLFADLRRTCHHSITLEGTTARFWHHSRSGAAVSDPFDINGNKNELIQWILFTSFASDYELGFDSTVTRVMDNTGQWQYQFDVLHKDKKVRTYQTVKALLERCYMSPYNRAMRVFEVRRVTEKGNGDLFSKVDTDTYALQDYWCADYEQSKAEIDVQRELYWALKANTRSTEELREVWQHFMEILADGVMEWKDMRNCMPGSAVAAEPIAYNEDKVSRAPKDDRANEAFYRMLGWHVNYAPRSVARKRRRTLHAHVCVDLVRVHDPAVFFFALDQATFVLSWLRRIGWLHRDISTGNLMLRRISLEDEDSIGRPLRERYQFKLHDLEYALEYSETSPDDPRMGTSDFLAVEVPESTYKFAPESLGNRGPKVKFHRNFFHDLESLAWIALDFATTHVPRHTLLSEEWRDLMPTLNNMWQRHCALFPNKVESWTDRVDFLVDPEPRKKLAEILEQVYGAGSPLSKMPEIFSALRDAYVAVESRVSNAETLARGCLPAGAFAVHAGIYDVFRQAFREISDYYAAEEGQGPLVSIRHIDWSNGKIYAHRDIKPVAKVVPKAVVTVAPKAMAKVAPKAKEIKTPVEGAKVATKKRKESGDSAANLRRSKRLRKVRS
ncbi:hypothetical protein GGF50DRAFT_120215 [Schizophyllum commune]